MSMTFSPCVMDDADLTRFQSEYPEGVTDFSDPAIKWPNPSKTLSDAWNVILREEDEWRFSVNLSNHNAIKTLTALNVNLDRDPEGYVIQYSGRIELEDLIDRCRDALRSGITEEYLNDRVIDIFEIALRCVGRGFSHISWG